ncbi:3-ketoacyl-CoA thiolase [Psychrobacter sp. JCM 18901]|nr:3-ketoacyl-CoA thiolase [Psychrobacter sp. JCM 18901]
MITPYKGLTRDNNLRPDTTLEKLGKLKPVFGRKKCQSNDDSCQLYAAY